MSRPGRFGLTRSTPFHPVTSRRADGVASNTAVAAEEKFEFQAEVSKVMDIIINSLYSNKDVFLRELVSNAADACDKKRFLALTDRRSTPETMKLQISADRESRLLVIEDNGVGMTRQELINNLGRIASSGTAKFMEQLGSGTADVSQIGQFGVGFYSAFLVADKIEVYTKSFKDEPGDREIWKWESDGSNFHVSVAPEQNLFGEDSGTKLVLHLKQKAEEYLDNQKLADLLKKYSEFITFPIELWHEQARIGA